MEPTDDPPESDDTALQLSDVNEALFLLDAIEEALEQALQQKEAAAAEPVPPWLR
jgi:hypothetical protein